MQMIERLMMSLVVRSRVCLRKLTPCCVGEQLRHARDNKSERQTAPIHQISRRWSR